MTRRTSLVAANWKMNGSRASGAAWLEAFAPRRRAYACDVVVCAPAVYLAALSAAATGSGIDIGAQDVSDREPGAYTGDVAAAMLIDIGCRWVIVGHSERRQLHGEDDGTVAAKAEASLKAGLRPIICIGETLAEREAGRTQAVVGRQLDAVLDRIGAVALARGALAYEPVWAIGTGRTATSAQAQEVHFELRARIAARDPESSAALRILYGGSVKSANAAELFAQTDIDGGLIGGASLVAGDFAAICAAAR